MELAESLSADSPEAASRPNPVQADAVCFTAPFTVPPRAEGLSTEITWPVVLSTTSPLVEES